MILFTLLISTFQDRWATLHLFRRTSRFLALLLHFWILRVDPWYDVKQCLIIDWQDAICVIDEHVQGEHRVVGWSDHVVVIRGEYARWETEHRWIQIRQILQDKRPEARACTTSDRMKKEEALQTVTFFDGLPDPFFNLIFVKWPILVMATGPVVAGPRLVTDTLTGLKYVLQFTVQDLVIDDPWLHINYDRARFQISYHRACL